MLYFYKKTILSKNKKIIIIHVGLVKNTTVFRIQYIVEGFLYYLSKIPK